MANKFNQEKATHILKVLQQWEAEEEYKNDKIHSNSCSNVLGSTSINIAV